MTRYLEALRRARAASPRVAAATTAPEDMDTTGTEFYLSPDEASGFGVTSGGDLVGLFSLVPGRGRSLVSQAVSRGARTLDCFDGFLPGFYASLGFVETGREPNWTPGGPDVVFMELAHR